MSIAPVTHLRRTARIAYSRHPVARLCQIWRSIAGDPPQTEVFLLPLAGLALTLFVLSLPGASDAITEACTVACMP